MSHELRGFFLNLCKFFVVQLLKCCPEILDERKSQSGTLDTINVNKVL
jgi:hypothetical protein